MEEKRKKLRQLFEAICLVLGYDMDLVASPRRDRELADVRMVYFRLASERYPDIILREIGRIVKRDHSTVIYGIGQAHTVKDIVAKYDKFLSEYSEPMVEERLIEIQ